MTTTTENPSTSAMPDVIRRNKSVGWYEPTLENITSAQRDVLENYSGIPPDRVIPHILAVVGYHFALVPLLTRPDPPS